MYMVASWACVIMRSSHKEALKKSLLFENYSDHTSPTSKKTQDKYIAVSVVYHTF